MRKEADRVAGAVASLLALVIAVLVLIGVLATPLLIAGHRAGYSGRAPGADHRRSSGFCFRASACSCCRRGASAS